MSRTVNHEAATTGRLRTRWAASIAAVAVTLATLVAVVDAAAPVPAAAAPGTPGTPSAPVEIFHETFELGQGPTATRLVDYVGVAGQSHTADPFWLRVDHCNGVIVQYEAAVFPTGYCSVIDPTSARNNARRMADVLGQVDAGVVGSSSTATPADGSTAATRANNAVAAYTLNLLGPDGAIQFQTSPVDFAQTGTRFYTTSVDVAELSCTYLGGVNNSRLRFSLLTGGTEYPLTSGGAIRACTDTRSRAFTSPALPGGWGSGGNYVAAGRFTAGSAALLTAAQINAASIVMRNDVGRNEGNDAAFDNIRLLDATPQLDKAFSPASVPTGGTSTLTLTVTNTSELAEKVGWAFTDALPAGLVVKNPANVGGTCVATVTAAAGSSSVAVSGGRLNAGQASCTITVDVTSSAAGTYENCAANIQNPIGMNLPGCAEVEFTSTPFRCTADVVYGLNTSGAILAINRTTGASVQEGYFPSGASALMNGLAITPDARYAYAVTQSGTKTVYRYDTVTGAASALGTIPGVSANLFMGAVNPVNGLYYVGGVLGSEYFFYAFDPATGASLGQQFRVTAPAGAGAGANGDLVFDSQGRAFIVMSTAVGATGNQLVVVDSPPSTGALTTARLLAYPAPTNAQFQGITFGSDGYLYTQHTAATRMLSRVDPNSGAQVSSTTILNPDGSNNTVVSDLSSCTLNSTLTLQKDVEGRRAAGDQFTVTITGNGVAAGNTGTTSGTSTGLQTAASATAGAVVGVPGRTYTITETAAGGANLANYRTTWECVDTSDGDEVVAAGTGATGTVTMPLGSNAGSHVVCVFTNVPRPTWTLAKEALRDGEVLAVGATVRPGEVVTYRVTATNTSSTAVSDAQLTDDLSDVLDDATFVAGSAELVIDGGAPIAVDDPVGGELVTEAFTLPASAIALLTYRVTVDADAWSTTLTNVVTGASGTPGDPAPTCPTGCTTTQITPSPVQIQKVGEASTGDVVPMDGSQWAIWDAATGGAAVVDPVPAAIVGGNTVTGLFRDVTLTPGAYWLEETRALDGFVLLAERVPFVVAADGTVTLGADASSNVTLVDIDGITTIRVEDVPVLDLPDTGGPGTIWFTVIGLLLLLAAAIIPGIIVAARRRRRPPRRRLGPS